MKYKAVVIGLFAALVFIAAASMGNMWLAGVSIAVYFIAAVASTVNLTPKSTRTSHPGLPEVSTEYSIPNPFDSACGDRHITEDELRLLGEDIWKAGIGPVCWAHQDVSIPVDGGTNHTVTTLVLALINEIRQLKKELEASISMEAHEDCCAEAARQAASCNMDHHAEALELRRQMQKIEKLAGELGALKDGRQDA